MVFLQIWLKLRDTFVFTKKRVFLKYSVSLISEQILQLTFPSSASDPFIYPQFKPKLLCCLSFLWVLLCYLLNSSGIIPHPSIHLSRSLDPILSASQQLPNSRFLQLPVVTSWVMKSVGVSYAVSPFEKKQKEIDQKMLEYIKQRKRCFMKLVSVCVCVSRCVCILGNR